MNETELAYSIAAGITKSPTPCAGFWLVAMRITGTGCAYRSALKEGVFRDPSIYLNPNFLARCNGLPIIAEHQDGTLDGPEYEARALGSIVLPYIANSDGVQDDTGDQVWGIGRIYSAEVVEAMTADPDNPLSTSPCVVFRPADGNERMEMPDGQIMLIEGDPSLICSLAICSQGVWDKGMSPHGIRVDSEPRKDIKMTEEEMAVDRARKDAEEKGKLDKILEHLSDSAKRMDAVCARLDSIEKGKEETAEEKEKREKADRKDGDPLEINHGKLLGTVSAKDMDEARKADHANLEAQARADTAYQSWGLRAPPPMQSETPTNYRRRLLRPMQSYSETFKDADLDVLSADPKAFGAIEGIIFADSVRASKNPASADGRMTKRVTQDPETGHRVTTFHGGDSIFKQFSMPSLRVTKFLTPSLTGENRR